MLLLALDQGTTSSRAIAIDASGEAVAAASRPLAARYPRPGWVEQDAGEIWSTQRDAAAEVLAALGDRAERIAAVGVANQRETVVLWDRATGEPLGPAIVWQDRRTTPACRRMIDRGLEDDVRARTGLRLDPYFSATKAAWLLDDTEGLRERALAGEVALGTVDAWLLWNLTGGRVHATDVTNASRTLLLDLASGSWDEALCDRFGVPRAALPEVRGSLSFFGEVGSADRGLEPLRGVAVRGILGDQQAALLGQGCLGPGPVKCTYGTGCFLLTHTGPTPPASENRLLATAAAGGPGEAFALEGGVFVGGAVVQWLRDQLGFAETTREIAALAASVPDAGGVVLVPALAGLGAPHWDPDARGSVQGLTAGTTKAHLCRAAIDAIACQVAELVDAMAADLGDGAATELRVDGGASANDGLMQLQADLLRMPVVRPRRLEATALGAAVAAGVGAGVWDSLEAAVGRCTPGADRFEPRMDEAEAHRLRGRYAEAVARCRGWNDGRGWDDGRGRSAARG
ncbi:glycerol kinase GlpK [Phycisphaera mikurensis]|uniref:ATP:glycerol 3-phosphotransferase n=1 Tax=Phycisphaera mikurensis (strain NBRC 102666 / KCTC 22515 / FYK2301M01) TaxID=1142394 RepID=I0IGV7_PHYMF|nr:glycerol kinase GlpK [Phycisphaera mikurensis]MBB6440752.1 glycerol kinase [Phycisphaera mikurensis]BAM04495.1 glycerol kinase [Phycisphaera mikurensis NBRC 102666]